MTDERARGFPAFGKSRPRTKRDGSWWGNAWVQAMEDTALDLDQLRKGRRYAASGVLGPITVSPGLITASVHDAADVYRTEVRMAPLGDAEWERFLDRVAERAGHIVALLERDMPRDLIEAAADAGVRLLPDIADLEPECDCEGWELPCRHAAALCYQVAWLLDADPFVLLLLRGRAERELLAELQRRNAAPRSTMDDAEPTESGVAAATAYAEAPAALPETGEPAAVQPGEPAAIQPGEPAVVQQSPALHDVLPESSDVDIEALEFLVADAAARATAILDGAEPAELDTWQDSVRLASAAPAPILARLRAAAEQPVFDQGTAAWGYGESAALSVLCLPWDPEPSALSRASTALAEVSDVDVTVWRNRCSAAETQLRYGQDGRWYPYRGVDGEWWPAGPAHHRADAALAELASG